MGASPACLDSLPPCEPGFTALFPSLRKNPAERMSYLELMVSVHGKCPALPPVLCSGWVGLPARGLHPRVHMHNPGLVEGSTVL